MKIEHLIMSKPYPKFKIVLSDGEAMVVSIGKYYYRISVDIKNYIPKWVKQIVADHYFYKWVETKEDSDLELYLIWSY